jgi:hypothetical protein
MITAWQERKLQLDADGARKSLAEPVEAWSPNSPKEVDIEVEDKAEVVPVTKMDIMEAKMTEDYKKITEKDLEAGKDFSNLHLGEFRRY